MTDITDLLLILVVVLLVLVVYGLVIAARRLARFLKQIPVVKDFAPEAPTIPKTAIKSMAARERIAQSYDMGAKRKVWARDMELGAEIYEMIGKVRERDHRG